VEIKKVTDAQCKDGEIKRREFCNRLLLTSTGVLIAATTRASEAPAQEHLLVYPPLKIEGAERLMPGSSLYFTYPHSDPAILVRAQDGQFYAYGQRCSHMGCSIYFERASGRLECPCHKGAYDSKTGFVMNGPPTRPLDLIVLQVRAGGEVWAVGRRIGSSDRNCSFPQGAESCS